jgi:hypothetical protein
MPYPDMVEHVRELMARPPLCGNGDDVKPAQLVIDETGVGRAVGDIFEQGGMKPLRITITGASVGDVSWQSNTRVHVSKTTLVSTVDAMLHRGVLKFAAALDEAETMKGELLDFRRTLSAAGRATYQARVGKHDDLLLATSIAAWFITLPPPAGAAFGSY